MRRIGRYRLTLGAALLLLAAAPAPVEVNSWSTMTPAPASFGHGAAIAYPGYGDFIYALRGRNTPTFFRYSVTANSWATMAPAPDAVHHGGAIVGTGGDHLYALRAHDTATFWRYSIPGNSWTALSNAPAALEHGAALVYAGGDFLYSLRGRNSNTFYRYSISAGAWTPLAALPAAADQGAALAYPGSGDFLYALRGKDSRDFYRYSISGNSWSVRASTPATIHYIEGALSSSGNPDHLYALRGSHYRTFWRYSIAANCWTAVASTPCAVEKGAALCSYPSTSKYIFATRGDNSTTLYRYEGSDSRAPEVKVTQASDQADPTAASPIHFTVQFSEPVSGFNADDVSLSGSAGATTATVSGGPTTYSVSVSGMTGDGTVTVAIPAGAATDGSNVSLASTSPDDTVLYSAIAPTVTVEQSSDQADPTAASPIHFTVQFSEPVTGFDADDVSLMGSAGATTVEVTGGPIDYTVAVGGMTSDGTVTVEIPAGAAVDSTGNPSLASSSADNTATYDTTPPDVTVKVDPSQSDPTATSPITFIVEFSEPVTGFDPGGVSVTGSAGATTVTIEGGPTTYTIEVTGMTGDGMVTVGIPAGAAGDPAGNPNSPSTSDDDTVSYDTTPPAVTVTPSHPGSAPDVFLVEFSEPVTGFGDQPEDVSVTGPAGTTTVVVTGGPTNYTVEVGGRGDGETVTVTIPAGAAEDPAGNPSLSSVSTGDGTEESGAGRLMAGYCATSASAGGANGFVVLVGLILLASRIRRRRS